MITAIEIASAGTTDLLKRSQRVAVPFSSSRQHSPSTRHISSREELEHALYHIRRRRATDSTVANVNSSRSHLVVTIKINNYDEITFALIDLAGLEVLDEGDKSVSTFINLSLNALFNVVNAIADGAAVVPYRQSPLTTLLKPFMIGKVKLTFIMTIKENVHSRRGDHATLKLFSTLKYCSRHLHRKNDQSRRVKSN